MQDPGGGIVSLDVAVDPIDDSPSVPGLENVSGA
jgi:hypothetical protein